MTRVVSGTEGLWASAKRSGFADIAAPLGCSAAVFAVIEQTANSVEWTPGESKAAAMSVVTLVAVLLYRAVRLEMKRRWPGGGDANPYRWFPVGVGLTALATYMGYQALYAGTVFPIRGENHEQIALLIKPLILPPRLAEDIEGYGGLTDALAEDPDAIRDEIAITAWFHRWLTQVILLAVFALMVWQVTAALALAWPLPDRGTESRDEEIGLVGTDAVHALETVTAGAREPKSLPVVGTETVAVIAEPVPRATGTGAASGAAPEHAVDGSSDPDPRSPL